MQCKHAGVVRRTLEGNRNYIAYYSEFNLTEKEEMRIILRNLWRIKFLLHFIVPYGRLRLNL